MQNFYDVAEHGITVQMVCSHALDQQLHENLTTDIMSYLYGVHENIAVYGNDQLTRQRGIIEMNAFDEAINLIDEAINTHPGAGSGYVEQLHAIANSGEEPQTPPQTPPMAPPPGFEESQSIDDSPVPILNLSLTQPQSMIEPQLMPPPLIRYW